MKKHKWDLKFKLALMIWNELLILLIILYIE